jgi:tetratricopeptide (TPR) repeat protein
VWRGFRHRVRHGRDPFRKAIAVGALSAAATLALHSVLDFNLRLPANALVFATVAGLAGCSRDERRPAVAGRAAPAIAAAAFAVLGALAFWRAAGAHGLTGAVACPPGDRRLAALDPLLGRHPYLAEAWRLRGVEWRARGWARADREGALAWAESDLLRATALRPRWGEAWADVGWTRFGRGDLAGAREAFERAAALDPTHIGIERARAEFAAQPAAEASLGP